ANRGKEAARYAEAERPLRLVASDQVGVPPFHRREVIDRAGEIAPPVEEVRRRDGFAAGAEVDRRDLRDRDDAIDRRHVEGTYQQRVDDAEDGGVGAEPE